MRKEFDARRAEVLAYISKMPAADLALNIVGFYAVEMPGIKVDPQKRNLEILVTNRHFEKFVIFLDTVRSSNETNMGDLLAQIDAENYLMAAMQSYLQRWRETKLARMIAELPGQIAGEKLKLETLIASLEIAQQDLHLLEINGSTDVEILETRY